MSLSFRYRQEGQACGLQSLYLFLLEGKNLLGDGREVGTNDLVDDSAILKEDESWHARDLVLAHKVLMIINIYLQEGHSRLSLRELLDFRGDALARPAPLSVEVNNNLAYDQTSTSQRLHVTYQVLLCNSSSELTSVCDLLHHGRTGNGSGADESSRTALPASQQKAE